MRDFAMVDYVVDGFSYKKELEKWALSKESEETFITCLEFLSMWLQLAVPVNSVFQPSEISAFEPLCGRQNHLVSELMCRLGYRDYRYPLGWNKHNWLSDLLVKNTYQTPFRLVLLAIGYSIFLSGTLATILSIISPTWDSAAGGLLFKAFEGLSLELATHTHRIASLLKSLEIKADLFEEIRFLVLEACHLETAYVESVQNRHVGIDTTKVKSYVRYVTHWLLNILGDPYGAERPEKNPFPAFTALTPSLMDVLEEEEPTEGEGTKVDEREESSSKTGDTQ